ncbi:MAG: efflux RND transporter periplasmic adaptor subunit [Cyanobacteria bacterium Co-bin13]|nr:efflux RND transporter periplasmic adaptor subunit [Cyanobacteria bacterium Co-bin13]
MKFPLIGKVRRPLPWLLGLAAAGLVVTGTGTALVLRSRPPEYDVAALTVPVAEEALTVRITASGNVQPVQTVNLSPKTSGILEELYVEQGESVTAGQLIARMNNEDIRAQLRQNQAAVAEAEAQLQEVLRGSRTGEVGQAQAAVNAAEAQVRDAEARLSLAQDQLSRNQQLFERGAISETELENARRESRSAQAGYEQAQARVEELQQRLQDVGRTPEPEAVAQAQARLERARAQVQAAQVTLDDTLIRAPFDGVITQRFATQGAFVTPTTSASDATSATSTAIVALARDLEILAEVPEADISQIQAGQRVEIRADAFPEQVFQGQVRLIAPEAIERQSVTLFQVRVELLSGKDVLRSNMNVNVAFIGDQLENALVVPTVAVVTQAGTTGVLVPGGNRNEIRFQAVTLGPQVGDQIQVLDGLQPGERVFVDLPPGRTLENLTLGNVGQGNRNPSEEGE